jgi:hypothetical protein
MRCSNTPCRTASGAHSRHSTSYFSYIIRPPKEILHLILSYKQFLRTMANYNSLIIHRRPALIPTGIQLSPADQLAVQQRITPLPIRPSSSTAVKMPQNFDFQKAKFIMEYRKRKASTTAEEHHERQPTEQS